MIKKVGSVIKKYKHVHGLVVLLAIGVVFGAYRYIFQEKWFAGATSINFVQTNWAGGESASNAVDPTDRTGWTNYTSKDTNISVVNGGADLQLVGSAGAYQFVGNASTTYTVSSTGAVFYDAAGAATNPSSPFSGWTVQDGSSATTSNDVRYETRRTTANNQYDFQLFKYPVTEATSTIKQMTLTWEGYGESTAGYPCDNYLWNNESAAWDLATSTQTVAGVDSVVASSTTPDPVRYVSSTGGVYHMVRCKHENYSPTVSDAGRSPANGATGVAVNPTLSWTAWADSDGNTPQYFSDIHTGSCTGPFVNSSDWGSASWALSGLSNSTAYYWRTMGRSTGYTDNTASSTCYSFTTVAAAPVCGNSIVEAGEQCDPPGGPYGCLVSGSWTCDASCQHIDNACVDVSSCPYLYYSYGGKDTYITDLSGNVLNLPGRTVSKAYKGTYVNVGNILSENGKFTFKFRTVEPEIEFIDDAYVELIDHPADTEIAISGVIAGKNGSKVPLEQKIFTLKNARTPIKAVDAHGVDVAHDVSAIDNIAIPRPINGEMPMQDYYYDLTFGDITHPEFAKLIFDVWRAYPERKDVKEKPEQSYIEVENEKGQWEKVQEFTIGSADFKQNTLEIHDVFKSKNRTIRFHTGKHPTRIRIDRIRLDDSEPVPVSVTRSYPDSATFFYGGLPNYTPVELLQRQFSDGANISNTDWRYAGNFTKYGDVLPLLAGRDDKYIIARRGDQIDMTFPDKPTLGEKRTVILQSYVWYKSDYSDISPELTSKKVEPLPFVGMTQYPYDTSKENYPYDEDHKKYLEEWNTRVCTKGVEKCETKNFSEKKQEAKQKATAPALSFINKIQTAIKSGSEKVTQYIGSIWKSVKGIFGKKKDIQNAGTKTEEPVRSVNTDFVSLKVMTGAALISSAYKTPNASTTIATLSWTETVPAGTNVKFQMRSAPDAAGVPGIYTDWMGYGGTTTTYFDDTSVGCSKPVSVVTCAIASSIDIGDGEDDRWFEYKVWLESDGVDTPTLSDVTVGFDNGIPTPPTDIATSTISDVGMTVSWTDNSNNERGFIVDSSTDGISFSEVSTVAVDVTSLAVSSLTPNTAYWFRVAASSTNGASAYVTTTGGTYTSSSVPGIATVSDVTTSTLTLTWDASSNPGSTTYYILDSSGAFLTTDATSYDVIGLTPSTEYQFQIRAENIGSPGTYSAYSASSTVTTTLDLVTIPPAPTEIATSTITTSGMTVSWVDNSNNETGFVLDSSTDGISYSNVLITSADATSQAVGSLAPNTAYWFRVAATGTLGISPYVTTTGGTYTKAADPTSLISTASTTNSITLSYSANSNPEPSTSYYITGNNSFTPVTTSTLTPILTGLTPNTSYTFTVKSVNSDGSTNSAVTVSDYTKSAVPGTPTVTDVATSTLTLAWSASSNPASTVYYVLKSDGTTATTDQTSLGITGLLPGTSYQFQVRAEYLGLSGTYSAYSASSTATTTQNTPDAPTNIATSTITTSGITVSWTDNSSNETGFIVEKSTDGISFSSVATTAAGATAQAVSSLTPNSVYWFRVAATNAYGDSTYVTTTGGSYTNAADPTSLISTASTTSSITLSYGANSNPNPGTSYYITGNNSFTPVTTSTLTPILTGLTPNTNYTFTVKSVNNDGTMNSAVTISDYTNPATPGTATAYNSASTSLSVSWDSNSNSNSTVYYLLYSDGSYATTTATIVSVGGLTVSTAYQFQVRAEHAGIPGTYTDYSASSTAVSTLAAAVAPAPAPVTVSAPSGGSGYGGGASAALLPPPPAPIAIGNEPAQPLQVRINNDNAVTNSTLVDLTLNGGNARMMAVTNDPTFAVVGQEAYSQSKKWDLCFGISPCTEGTHTVYVKYYTDQGSPSQIYSDSIEYKVLVQPLVSDLGKPEAIVSTVIDAITPKPIASEPPATAEEIRQENPQLAEEIQKAEVPFVFENPDLIQFPIEPMRELVNVPFPKEISVIVNKFPELQQTFKSVGVTTLSDLSKLESVTLVLPGINRITAPTPVLAVGSVSTGSFVTQTVLPGVGTFAVPVEPRSISELTPAEKEKIPTDVVFAKGGSDRIDLQTRVSVDEATKKLVQTIQTTSNKDVQLSVKPDGKVRAIKGMLLVRDVRKQPTAYQKTHDLLIRPVSADTEFVLDTFEYTDTDNDGIYTTSFRSPAVDGKYEVVTTIDFVDTKRPSKELRLITLIDPEGYVYRRFGENEMRIKNATVSIFVLDMASGEYKLWESERYNQINPQVTDKTGRYSFLVPEGIYYLKVDAKGHRLFSGQAFVVKEGMGVHENIELIKTSWWTDLFDLIRKFITNITSLIYARSSK